MAVFAPAAKQAALPPALLQEAWGGRLPLRFALAQGEVTTLRSPSPFYAMGPRVSYLPVVAAAAVAFLRASAPDVVGGDEEQVWFEAGGRALPWQLPLGVLYDALCERGELPWAVTVHFRGYPSAELLACRGPATVSSHFFHAAKQGLCLRHGSCRVLMELRKDYKTQLFEGVKAGDLGRYWGALQQLYSRGQPETVRVPVRLVQRAAAGGGGGGGGGDAGRPLLRTLQVPVPCKDERTGGAVTLGGALERLLLPAGRAALEDIRAGGQREGGARLLVAGVEAPPLDTPLVELCAVLAHPDSWLYLVVAE